MTDVFISPSSQWANQFAGGPAGVEDSEGKHMRDIAPLIHALCQRNGIDSHLSLNESLYARVQESNRMASKLHFALHSNAGGTAWGASTWVYTLGTKSEIMARAIQRRLAALTPWSDLGTIRYNHYETRETHAFAVIAEVAFHDKTTPAEWIRTHKRDIAIACTQGIIDALAAAYGGKFTTIAARPLMLDGGTGMAPIVTAPTPTPQEDDVPKAIQFAATGQDGKGHLYVAFPNSRTFDYAESLSDLADIEYVLRAQGFEFVKWPETVKNPAAFGQYVGPDFARPVRS